MGVSTRLRRLDWNGYMHGLKTMVVVTMRDPVKSALMSQATMYDVSGVSASVFGTARARKSGRRVIGFVL